MAEAQTLSTAERLAVEEDKDFVNEALAFLTTAMLYDEGLLDGEIDTVADHMFQNFDEKPSEEEMIAQATQKVLTMNLRALIDRGIMFEGYLIECYIELLNRPAKQHNPLDSMFGEPMQQVDELIQKTI